MVRIPFRTFITVFLPTLVFSPTLTTGFNHQSHPIHHMGAAFETSPIALPPFPPYAPSTREATTHWADSIPGNTYVSRDGIISNFVPSNNMNSVAPMLGYMSAGRAYSSHHGAGHDGSITSTNADLSSATPPSNVSHSEYPSSPYGFASLSGFGCSPPLADTSNPHYHGAHQVERINSAVVVPSPAAGYPSTAIPTSTAVDAHPSPTLERSTRPIPTFRCEMPDCGADVAVDKKALLIHLLTVHDYPPTRRGQSVYCLWPGCFCKKQGADGTRCKGRDPGHMSHAEDIVEHIWDAHLDFQDVCPKCGDAGWTHAFSKGRHEKACDGKRQPARCRACRVVFRSTVAFAGHLELELCPGSPPSTAE
jgi:hypothetical protein